jgi:hypothetical protein
MPAQNGNGGRGGPWGSGDRPGTDIENLVRQGQDRLKQTIPSGVPRLGIVLAVLALAGLTAWTAYYTVPSDSVAVVQRFGKYLKDVQPGLQVVGRLPLAFGHPSSGYMDALVMFRALAMAASNKKFASTAPASPLPRGSAHVLASAIRRPATSSNRRDSAKSLRHPIKHPGHACACPAG